MLEQETNNEGPPTSSLREEKLSALAALLGPEAMARLRSRNEGFAGPGEIAKEPTAERLAWHRGRLLERLRARWAEAHAAESEAVETDRVARTNVSGRRSENAQHASARGTRQSAVDSRIAAGLDLGVLDGEHPAVISRVLHALDRGQRVELLRRLPGHTARDVIRRLKSD